MDANTGDIVAQWLGEVNTQARSADIDRKRDSMDDGVWKLEKATAVLPDVREGGVLTRMRQELKGLIIASLISAALLIGPISLKTQAISPDPRFGIVEAFVNAEAATEVGAGYTRIVLRWDVIQPAGLVDWKPANVPDPFIDAELAAGREVVGLLIGTPAWAAAEPGGDARSVPDMFYWEAFVRRMAAQYRGRIKHWIIWNEPDVWDVTHPGSTWTGSESDYYRLLKTAFLAIKSVDPEIQVHLAGLTYFWDWTHGRTRYLDRLLDVIVADPDAPTHDYYFDAVVYHLYFNPAHTVRVLQETRETLATRGIEDKLVWINETNAPPSDDPAEPPWSAPRYRISQAEQAAFVIQAFALAFASGASRVAFYKLRNSADHPESIEPYGLLRGDDSRRPAFEAYRTATTYLRDFRAVDLQRQGDLFAVTFDRNDRTATVLWTVGRQAARVRVRPIAEQAMLVDETGVAGPIQPLHGVYVIDLPGAKCSNGAECFIGGAPRLLVEAGASLGRVALVSPPTATPARLAAPVGVPTSSPTTAPTVTPTSSATPTLTPTLTSTPSITPPGIRRGISPSPSPKPTRMPVSRPSPTNLWPQSPALLTPAIQATSIPSPPLHTPPAAASGLLVLWGGVILLLVAGAVLLTKHR